MALSISHAIGGLVLGWVSLQVARLVYNIFLHPLKSYPGPIGAQATEWYKTYIELFQQKNWTDQLIELHQQYGESARTRSRSLIRGGDKTRLNTCRKCDTCVAERGLWRLTVEFDPSPTNGRSTASLLATGGIP